MKLFMYLNMSAKTRPFITGVTVHKIINILCISKRPIGIASCEIMEFYHVGSQCF